MQGLNIKKISFLIVGIVLVGSFSAFLINKNFHDPRVFAPVMYVESDMFDFGEIPQGPQVAGEFKFKNVGQNVLVIKGVKPSCGCTGVVLNEKKEYAPGEDGVIKFTFNTEGRVGKNDKTITVETNDPKNATKTLAFTCNITAPPAK